MDSLRPSDLKKEESINRFCDFSVRWPLPLVWRCVCVSVAFILNFSLWRSFRVDWNWREKCFWPLAMPVRLCVSTRDVRQFSSKRLWMAGGQRTTASTIFSIHLLFWQYMLSIILIFIHFACTTANLWRRPDPLQQQFRKKGAVQFNRNVEHKLQVFSDNFCAFFFSLLFFVLLNDHMISFSHLILFRFLCRRWFSFRSHSLEEQKQFSSTKKWSINRCQ